MRASYRVLGGLICLLVLVQAAGIAFGTFGILNFIEDGNDYNESVAEDGSAAGAAAGQAIHSWGAAAITLVAIVWLVVSFFAKIDGGVKWAGFVFLSVLAQWILAVIAFAVPAVGLLHGINAFVMFGLAMAAVQNARGAQAARTPVGERQPA
jgi:hypothetical protein